MAHKHSVYDTDKHFSINPITTVYSEENGWSIMDIPDTAANVEKIVLSEFNCTYIKGLIERLDWRYRDVLILKSMELGYHDIAKLLDISEELARKRYSRAKAKLIETGGETLYEYGQA